MPKKRPPSSDENDAPRKRTRDPKMTAEHKAECKRLQDLYKERAEGKVSQAEFAGEYELGHPSNLGHYIHGRQPLNMMAALRFARGLSKVSKTRVVVDDFSKRLADEIRALVALADPVLVNGLELRTEPAQNGTTLTLSADEVLLLDHFRKDATGTRLQGFLQYEGIKDASVTLDESGGSAPGGSSAFAG